MSKIPTLKGIYIYIYIYIQGGGGEGGRSRVHILLLLATLMIALYSKPLEHDWLLVYVQYHSTSTAQAFRG